MNKPGGRRTELLTDRVGRDEEDETDPPGGMEVSGRLGPVTEDETTRSEEGAEEEVTEGEAAEEEAQTVTTDEGES